MTMLTLTSDSANLGDNLMLTPLLNATPCRLRLLDEEWMQFTAPVFNGLCEVEWIKERIDFHPPPAADIARPWSKRWLVAQGFNDVPAIPRIHLTEAEIEDGRRAADHMRASFGKPLCVIKGHPGRTTDRVVPVEIINRIVAGNPEIQFVTFNLSDTHPKRELRSPAIKGAYEFNDFPLRALASVYHAIGRYVGADTGDYHLMLAVGGRADVLCPAHSYIYNHDLTHYGTDCWLGELPRVSYHTFGFECDTSSMTQLRLQ